MFSTPTPFYMSYPSSGPIISSQSNSYENRNLVHQQEHAQLLQNAPVAVETVHLYVPNTVTGAIIGAKGLFIKSIIKNSNATVKVDPISSDEDQNKIIDRQVTITRTPEAQWKSRAEIYVPTSLFGHLVGECGHNVRQLQQCR